MEYLYRLLDPRGSISTILSCCWVCVVDESFWVGARSITQQPTSHHSQQHFVQPKKLLVLECSQCSRMLLYLYVWKKLEIATKMQSRASWGIYYQKKLSAKRVCTEFCYNIVISYEL